MLQIQSTQNCKIFVCVAFLLLIQETSLKMLQSAGLKKCKIICSRTKITVLGNMAKQLSFFVCLYGCLFVSFPLIYISFDLNLCRRQQGHKATRMKRGRFINKQICDAMKHSTMKTPTISLLKLYFSTQQIKKIEKLYSENF